MPWSQFERVTWYNWHKVHRILLLIAISVALKAQTQTDLAKLTRELRDAIEHDDLVKAADLGARLDDAVASARDAWLVRDARTDR